MQSIITKYHGPTVKGPSRISATSTSGIRKYFSYGHDRTDDQLHRDAAKAFAEAMEWSGTYHGGAYNDKGAQIWVRAWHDNRDSFTVADDAAPVRCACANCAWTGPESSLGAIKHLGQRVEPGEPMPSGECPDCGALAYPAEPCTQHRDTGRGVCADCGVAL